MLGRKLFSTGPVAVIVTALAIVGGCREATTAPSDPNSSAFASSMTVVSGNAQTGQIGAALSQLLTVKVVDAGGIPVQGATVTFAPRTGGGAISPATALSNAAGLVTATWTLGTTVGPQTAVAMLSTGFVSDSTSFSATATTGAAGVISLVSGNNQTATVGTTLPLKLVIHVTDTFGNNSSGAQVTWAAASLSGTVTPTIDSTGADGTASTTWTVGNTVATQTVTATVAGLPPIVFNAVTNGDTAHVVMTIVSGATQSGAASSALPAALSVRVTDRFGNPIVGDKLTWNGAISGGGTVSAITSTTDATGLASTSWTLGARAGAQTLQAVESGKSLTANFTGTATLTFSDVYAGNFMACGIVATNNLIYCWGVGDGGQLGRESATNQSTPTWPVTQTDTITGPYVQARQVSGGSDGFCALTIDRRLFCWGRNIGVSAVTSNVAAAEPIITGSSSQQILPNYMTQGEQHICLIDLTGLAFCTGSDLHGELGDSAGGTNPGTSPSIGTYPFVLHSPVGGWAKIAAGQAHTCGMPRFNPNDASSQIPRCWGLNTSGQVGDNTTKGVVGGSLINGLGGQQVPVQITLPVGVTAFDTLSITTGAQHSCGIAAFAPGIGGAAYCWGNNGLGQLGTAEAFTQVDSVPTAVAGGHLFTRIYAGTYHSCGIDAAGSAWCWGRNDYGQLGGGTASGFNTGNATPVQVTGAGGLSFRSLSVGELYTCGVTGTVGTAGGPSATAGVVYCWGNNQFGQIGNGTTSNSTAVLVPTKVNFQP
jgi:alpha-tubulin suppressor-like RCC1 family protein